VAVTRSDVAWPEHRSSSKVRHVPELAEPARLVNARRFLMGITNNDLDEVMSLLSPEVVSTVPGHNPLAGVYRGPLEVAEHLTKLLTATSGTLETLKWVDWLVGMHYVAALQFVQAEGGGSMYRNRHVYVIETDRNDLIATIRTFFEDEIAADTFLSGLPFK